MSDVVIVPETTEPSATSTESGDNAAIAVAAATQAAEAAGAAAAVAVSAEVKTESLESRIVSLSETLTLRFDTLENNMRAMLAEAIASRIVEPEPEPIIEPEPEIVPEPVPTETVTSPEAPEARAPRKSRFI